MFIFYQSALRFAAAVFAFAALSAHAAPRVATSDWTIAETLTAMGHPPVSVADRRVYDSWVNYPPLPASVKEAGLRFQPNLERLYQIAPDFFVQSPWYAAAKPQFEKIAPVYELSFGTPEGIEYEHTVAATRKLAALTGDRAAGERLVRETESLFARAKTVLAPYRNRPFAVVQFADARHLRIYGKTSLFQAVFDKIGVRNAWTGKSNEWGFDNIALPDLAKLPPDTVLIVVKPHPPNTRPILEKSTLWRRLPFSKRENRRIFEPSWSYGGLPSMQHFALQMMKVVSSENPSAHSANKEAAW